MLISSPSALASAAETRRRELPAACALAVLTGGLAAAIMHGAGPVGWAGAMVLLLIADAEIYRRLDAAGAEIRGRRVAALAAWAFATSAFYTVLPVALWLNGEAAAAAAAMVLWVAGVVRYCNAGSGKILVAALAGAAPPALTLVIAPFAIAFASTRPDWDLALIAAVGGGALMVYVAQARLSATEAERAVRAAAAGGMQDTLARIFFEQDVLSAVLVDARGCVVAMNKETHAYLPHADVIGRKFEDLIPWSPLLWRDTFARAIQGEHVRHEGDEIETAIGPRWFEWEARPWRGDDGAIKGVLTFGQDVTERKHQEAGFIAAMRRAENSLRAKSALLAEIGEAGSPEPAADDGRPSVGVAGMHERLAGLLEEMDARDVVLAEVLASLRAARDAAERASESKSRFLASMSHELRTPLNSIIGYSEILQEEAETARRDSDSKDIDRILSSARQLLHLINEILDLSKIEAGRMDVAASTFDLAKLIEGAAATVRPALEKNENRLILDISGDLGEARSDVFKLNQCLLNLLSNAVKFTSRGEVAIRARREKSETGADWIEIAVADTGIGISEEHLARLFNDFTQADLSVAREYGGAGLGLAITRRMMDLLGGEVGAASSAGQGSTFTLRFPARLADGANAARAKLSQAAGAAHSRIALVIDDEESARDLVARSLTRLGFIVRAAANGREGVELAKSWAPNVIVLDINLPDLDGWQVLAALRADPATAAIPIIVHSVDDDRQRALALGACEHLTKPIDRDVLAAVAARVARARAIPNRMSASPPLSSLAKTA